MWVGGEQLAAVVVVVILAALVVLVEVVPVVAEHLRERQQVIGEAVAVAAEIWARVLEAMVTAA